MRLVGTASGVVEDTSSTDPLTISLAYRLEDRSTILAFFANSIAREERKSSLIEISQGGHDSDFCSG